MSVSLNDGNQLPRETFGVYRIPPGQPTYDAVTCALKTGYRSIDTATLYRNEADVGRAVKDSGINRQDLHITTKVWDTDQGFHSTIAALDRSIKLLDTTYVDLYLIHSPRPGKQLRKETWKAMIHLKKLGKVKSIGVSNFSEKHLEELMESDETVIPAVNQIDLHPFKQRRKHCDYCKKTGIILQSYSPLTRGIAFQHSVLQDIARRHKASAAQVLLAWARQTNDAFVVKSQNEQHIRENFLPGIQLNESDFLMMMTLNEDLNVLGRDISEFE